MTHSYSRYSIKIKKILLRDLVKHVFLILFGLTMLIPFLWMISTSIKNKGEIFHLPIRFFSYDYQIKMEEKWVKVQKLTRKASLWEIKYLEGENIDTSLVVKDYRFKGSPNKPWVWSLENGTRFKRKIEKTGKIQPAFVKILLPDGEIKWVNEDIIESKLRIRWRNFIKSWRMSGLGRAYFNSTLIVLLVTIGQVTTSAMAAFAFSRLDFPGRNKIFLTYLATLMVPSSVVLIPVFILMKNLGWVDTYLALIIPPMFSAYGTFMLRQFFLGIPKDLENAAIIDGCGYFGIFRYIIIPVSKPALAALSIFTFMGNWRSFLWPLIVINSPSKQTIPLALMSFQGEYSTDWALLMAASLISIIPILVVFFLGQRFFVSGIQLGAVKG